MPQKLLTATAIVLTLVCTAPGARVEGEGEEKDCKLAETGVKEAMDLAVKSKSESVSWAAFGAYLRQEQSLSTSTAVRNMLRFAKRKGCFYRCALLVSFLPEWQDAAGALAKEKDSDATSLAAAIYATAALGDYLSAEKEERCGPMPGARSRKGKGGKAKAKGKGRRGKGLPPPVEAVAKELFASRDPQTRRLAIMAAAYANDKTAAEAIQESLKRSRALDPAGVFYFARQGTAPADRALIDFVKRPSRRVKPVALPAPDLSRYSLEIPDLCLICEALGKLKQERYVPILHQMLAHADVRIQCDAARAIVKVGSPESIPVFIKALSTCPWPVLVTICDNLGARPDKRAVLPLIERLAKEKGRLRLDVVHALSSIAGEQHGQTAEEWREWWGKNGATFEVDADATAAYREKTRVQDVRVPGNGFFYGLTIYSDRFCYVVDTSASMRGDRIASLRDNMAGSIKMLKDHVQYNIVDFGGDVVTMYPGALTGNKHKGIQRVEYMPLTFATRSYDAMERACFLPGLDTIYFLSDGAPVRGQTDSWLHIMRGLTIFNRYRPIAVFGIDFDPSPSNQRMMQRMAAENYGLNESVEI